MSAVSRYRKKPVEIEAVEFRGWANASEACEWADAYFVGRGYDHHLRHDNEKDRSRGDILDDAPPFLVIKTLEGSMRADVGDYIIREPFPTDDRQFYPCKPDIFASTYEPVQ